MYNFRDAVTAEQAAEILGVIRARVYQMVDEGKLDGVEVTPHLMLFERADVVALASEIDRGTRKTHPSRTGKPKLKDNAKPVRLEDCVDTSVAAEIIGVSNAEYVCYLIRNQRLPATRMHGKGYMVRRVDAEKYRDDPANTGRPRSGRRRRKKGD